LQNVSKTTIVYLEVAFLFSFVYSHVHCKKTRHQSNITRVEKSNLNIKQLHRHPC